MKYSVNSGITQEIVNEFLDYNPETGKLTWKPRDQKWFKTYRGFRIWNGRYANKEAFTSTSFCGYKHGNILDKVYKAHRIIWLMVHGEYPTSDIDHINGVRTDNRLCNLRLVTRTENCQNSSISKANKSGYVGVQWNNQMNKWKATIIVNKKPIHLGFFSDVHEAGKARKSAERKYGFHENHGKNLRG